jgi:hypothetical protein
MISSSPEQVVAMLQIAATPKEGQNPFGGNPRRAMPSER